MKKSKINTLIGLFLIPVIFCLFIIDRILLVFMPHLPAKAIQDFFFNGKEIGLAIWRLFGFSITALIVYLFTLRF